ncbi:serine/threonine protein kinase [Humibacillus sp. DSM 29435]|uniref:Stk1 family PASTA domain-containing Ser/Thr kinase n=1 Tax=Humibacillus sp. DSM 29435 TaxID=1869167 RepID=UPI0008726784|nr:Stk1 family PASTA domain-containing Ser/Thr kinase [Humibacillus sp. DSM 29435]OFE14180.1 serine/threonine protein kinase [Humibacillus sp. DSM 29435]
MSSNTRILGGRYEVGALIGRGGMADVHLGHDTRLGRQVAIKILRSDLARDPNFLTRFRREAQSAAGLNHPSIVAIFDSGEDAFDSDDPHGQPSTVPYIVMEYVDGHTLREQLNERGPFEPLEAIRVTEDILDALDYSHRMGIVHRDIKPANVMITARGVVKVMDYGIARAIADTAATMTQTQSVVGTAQYLSPEQAQGQVVDARSDLYSTGCLLFELLAGRPPFTGDSPVAIAYQHVGEAPAPPSVYNDSVGGDLDAVTLHALTKDREARYQTASDFRRDLENVRLGRPVSDAALGTADAIGAEPTQTIPAPYATPGTPTMVQPAVVAYDEESALGVGTEVDEPQKKGRGGKIALITIAVLAVLALAGWGVTALLTNRTPPPAAQVTVPQLVGKTDTAADRLLTANQLKGNATNVASASVAVGLVVQQGTPAGAKVDEQTTIEYTVSSGPDTVVVPDVSNQTQAQARKALEDAGFKVVEIVQENTADFDKDKVVKTDPAAGTTANKGADIKIHVATGNVQVPDDLVGGDFSVAAVRLTDLKLKPTRVDVASDKPSNQVLEVAGAGKVVKIGSAIEVKVAAAPTTPPSTVTTTQTITQAPPPPSNTGTATTPPAP